MKNLTEFVSNSRMTRKRPSRACLNNPKKQARIGSPFASVFDEREDAAKLILAQHSKSEWSPSYLVKHHSLAELAQMVRLPRTGPDPLKGTYGTRNE